SLCALIAFALLAALERLTFFHTPALHYMIHGLGARRRLLPLRPLELALGSCTLQQRALLADRVGQAREKRLIVSQRRRAHAALYPRAELPFVLLAVLLQLGELRFRFRDTAIERREASGEPPLFVVRETVNGLEAFGAGHIPWPLGRVNACEREHV